MIQRTDKKPFPVLGYVILNVIVLIVLATIYFASLAYAVHNRTFDVGLFPVLAMCYFAFLVVSILDALFDRLSVRPPTPAPEKPASTTERASASASKEVSKRTE